MGQDSCATVCHMAFRPLDASAAAEALMSAFNAGLIPEAPGAERDAWRVSMLTVVRHLGEVGLVIATYDPDPEEREEG